MDDQYWGEPHPYLFFGAIFKYLGAFILFVVSTFCITIIMLNYTQVCCKFL